MSKESNNLRSKKSHSSKPYDVSKSFVAKVASRVTELLPQRAWLNRWLAPAEAEATSSLVSSTPLVNSHSVASVSQATSLEHGPRPTKRPRLPHDSPYPSNKFLTNAASHEEISPIGPILSNDTSASAEPSGQLNRKPSFSVKQTTTPSRMTTAVPRSSAPTTITTKATIENIEKLNGGDDCSESSSESTSGCSSLVPQAQSSMQARHSDSRHHSFSGVGGGSLNGSLFPGRSNAKVNLSTLSRRRPSFNTTTFATSSKLHNSTLQSSQASPFYSGRTMYGGASAYHSTTSGLFAPSPRRTGVTVRPVNVANSSSTPALSSTARRILDALEQFSTPVVDAKRIPVVPGKKRKLERYPELTVPTTSDLLRVKRRERLQDSTCAARQASVSSSRPTSPKVPKYPGSSLPLINYIISESNRQKPHTGKVTRKMEMENDTIEEVDLPPAVLPIETLPVIDIAIPPPPSPALRTAVTAPPRPDMTPSITSKMIHQFQFREFRFSLPSPAQIDKDSEKCKENRCGQTCVNAEKFVFSEPCKWSVNSDDDSNKVNSRLSCTKAFVSSGGKGISLGGSKVSSPSVIKDDGISIEAVVESKKTNRDDNSWKCSICMVRHNKGSSKCTACDTPKPVPASIAPAPLIFKAPPDTWECKECFIRNKNALKTCAACAAPKPAGKSPSVSSSKAASAATAAPTVTTNLNSFGDKFKPPSDTWECKECFVRNNNTSNHCVSCTSAKPGAKAEVKKAESGFGSMFKKAEGSWECGSCMVQNNATANKCIACETLKPGAKEEKTAFSSGSGFKFGCNQNSVGDATFSFGNAANAKSETSASTNFVFGSVNAATPASSKFSFGMPPANSTDSSNQSPKEKKEKPTVNDKINPLQELAKLQEKQDANTPTMFKFGTVNHANSTSKDVSAPIKNFVFGVNGASKTNEVKPINEVTSDSKKAGSTFTFGVTSSDKNDASKPANNFAFQPKVEQSQTSVTNFLQKTQPEVKSTPEEMVKFGSPATTSTSLFSTTKTNASTNSLFMFGSGAAINKPASFGSGTSESNNQKNSTAVPEPVKRMIGATTNNPFLTVLGSTLSNSTIPVFGTPTTTAGSSIKGFGQDTPTTTAPSFLAFNSSAAPSPFQSQLASQPQQQEKPSLFSMPGANPGLQSNPAPQTGGAFSFGSSSAPAEQAKPPGYNFSVPAPAATGFSFGTPAAPAAQNFSFTPKENEQPQASFNFSAPAAPAAAPPPLYGVHQSTPSFGETSAPFAFDAQAQQPASSALFGFSGSQQAPTAAAPAPSTFVFGSANANPTPAATAQLPMPTFDPNARPTFNFTGGSTPSFTATSSMASPSASPASTARRPMKKAVRRTSQMSR